MSKFQISKALSLKTSKINILEDQEKRKLQPLGNNLRQKQSVTNARKMNAVLRNTSATRTPTRPPPQRLITLRSKRMSDESTSVIQTPAKISQLSASKLVASTNTERQQLQMKKIASKSLSNITRACSATQTTVKHISPIITSVRTLSQQSGMNSRHSNTLTNTDSPIKVPVKYIPIKIQSIPKRGPNSGTVTHTSSEDKHIDNIKTCTLTKDSLSLILSRSSQKQQPCPLCQGNAANGNYSDSNIKALFEQLMEKMDRIENKIIENNQMLMQLTNRKRSGVKGIPSFLPFKTLDDLANFDNANNDTFDELVNYFIYLGGMNAIDCAALFFRNSFDVTEEISTKVSWLGKAKGNVTALCQTRFAEACEEAMKRNINLSDQNRGEFIDGMTKALKSLKERNRRRRIHSDLDYSDFDDDELEKINREVNQQQDEDGQLDIIWAEKENDEQECDEEDDEEAEMEEYECHDEIYEIKCPDPLDNFSEYSEKEETSRKKFKPNDDYNG